MKPVLSFLLILGSFSSLVGCSRLLPEIVPFGAVKGVDRDRSLNGLGVYRKMWESAGAKCLTPQKLSPKLDTFDVVVLVGQSYGPPGKAARRWLEQWLAEERGRTVIYFGRDFNANVYYRQRTLARVPPDSRPRGEHALASAEVAELNTRLRQVTESTFCRWFYLDTTLPPREYTRFSGAWATDLAGLAGTWPVGVSLQPPENKWRSQKPSWLKKAGTNTLKPASQVGVQPSDAVVRRSVWTPEELDTTNVWNAEFQDLASYRNLLSGDDGQSLVFRLTDESFEGSQILVVANGAPVLNGSLVEPLHRALGAKLIGECLPADRVALLAYGERGLSITQTAEPDARAAGLEMLTVWPLSAITMPAALLGIIVCAVLFPILGRPQRLPRRSVSDFGLHIDALGRMLMASRDVEYARTMIEDYYRKVRRETPPHWLESIAGDSISSGDNAVPAEPSQAVTPSTTPQLQSDDRRQ